LFTNDYLKEIQVCLLHWFGKEGRDFPWRHQSDPYAILIAEKLLQQTAVGEVVVNAYQRLLLLCPDPLALAQAPVEVLEDIVKPLGLRYRAKELRTIGEHLVAGHGGHVPRIMKELMAIPGVGEYSAKAILSFAFGDDVAVVDTNVARFLYRLFAIPGKLPANPARKADLAALAQRLIVPGRSKETNWAILDLCAKVCRSNEPYCCSCPIQPYCGHAK
jgi:A/G-specific adenine glycosylase